MPCLLVILALLFPRVVLIILALFTNYLDEAYRTLIWPILGFFFMPWTTLAYAFSMHATSGSIHGFYLALIVIAALADLGSLGGGARRRRYRTRRDLNS